MTGLTCLTGFTELGFRCIEVTRICDFRKCLYFLLHFFQLGHCDSVMILAPVASTDSSSQHPQNERNHRGDQQSGRDRKEELKPVTLDVNVAGQTSQTHARQPRPQHAEYDQGDAYTD